METIVRYFAGLFVFSAAVASLFMALTVMIRRHERGRLFPLGAVFLLTAVLFLEHYLTNYYLANVRYTDNSFMVLLFISMKMQKLFIGPLMWCMYAAMIGDAGPVSVKMKMHFLPGFLIQAMLLLLTAVSFFSPLPISRLEAFFCFSGNLAILHLLAYVAALLVNILRFYRDFTAPLKSSLRGIFVAAILTFCGVLLLAVFIVNRIKGVETAGMVLLAMMSYLMIFNLDLEDALVRALSTEIRQIRYVRSLLSGVEISALLERLDSLMADEKLYCDEDLTLQRLAAHLEITPHQLSELLNSRMGKNFNSYINAFRVNEAKQLLLSQRDRSVLHIAYAVGFNTKSVFYKTFAENTGMSPGEYRAANS